jgi:hypothetical protein
VADDGFGMVIGAPLANLVMKPRRILRLLLNAQSGNPLGGWNLLLPRQKSGDASVAVEFLVVMPTHSPDAAVVHCLQTPQDRGGALVLLQFHAKARAEGKVQSVSLKKSFFLFEKNYSDQFSARSPKNT